MYMYIYTGLDFYLNLGKLPNNAQNTINDMMKIAMSMLVKTPIFAVTVSFL